MNKSIVSNNVTFKLINTRNSTDNSSLIKKNKQIGLNSNKSTNIGTNQTQNTQFDHSEIQDTNNNFRKKSLFT